MKLALSSLPWLPGSFDARAFDAIRAAGFGGIELWCADGHLPLRDAAAAEAVARRLRGAGLEVAAAHLPIHRDAAGRRREETLSVVDPDPAKREAALEACEAGVEAAEAAGARLVVLHLGGPGDGATRELRAFAEEALARVSGHAAARGIDVAVENVASPLTTMAVLNETIANVGRALVGVCVDVANARLGGGGIDALREAGRELSHVHLGEPGRVPDEHRLPDAGAASCRDALARLREAGYAGWVVVEGAPAGPADPCAALLSALRPFLDAAAERSGPTSA